MTDICESCENRIKWLVGDCRCPVLNLMMDGVKRKDWGVIGAGFNIQWDPVEFTTRLTTMIDIRIGWLMIIDGFFDAGLWK